MSSFRERYINLMLALVEDGCDDGRSRESRKFREQRRELWGTASDNDLEEYAKFMPKIFPASACNEKFEEILEDAKSTRERMRERMREISENPRRW